MKRQTRIFSPFALAILMVLSPAIAQEDPTLPKTPDAWRAMATTDLDAIRNLLETQTPIPFDRRDHTYSTWLKTGYEHAREETARVRDHRSYYYTIARYVNGFRDPHIQLNSVAILPPAQWPGFIVTARGDEALVVMRDESDSNTPAIGARILTCDGVPLSTLLEQRIYPYVMNPRLALDRRRAVSRLFLDRGIPGAPSPSACRVSVDGKERDIALRWRALPEPVQAFTQAYNAAAIGAAAQFGLSQPTPGVFWIGVPTFDSSDDNAKALEGLIDEVAAQIKTMRKGQAIVIDIRGNGGGNSMWADRLSKAIFGERAISKVQRGQQDHAVEWRASAENIAYWRSWLVDVAVPQFGETSESADFGREVVLNLEAALTRDPPVWRQGAMQPPTGGGLTQRRPQGRGAFPARVYMLSDGSCISSCLNFADTVLHMRGVRLIGSATGADGAYLEVRGERSPSGLVALTFPQKMAIGAPREPFEAYRPDIAYDGSWDDASVRRWVMDLIERESAATNSR